MGKKIYGSPESIRAWIKAAGFTSDQEAAAALDIPFRTFCRYKADGLPEGTAASVRSSHLVKQQMAMILARHQNHES